MNKKYTLPLIFRGFYRLATLMIAIVLLMIVAGFIFSLWEAVQLMGENVVQGFIVALMVLVVIGAIFTFMLGGYQLIAKFWPDIELTERGLILHYNDFRKSPLIPFSEIVRVGYTNKLARTLSLGVVPIAVKTKIMHPFTGFISTGHWTPIFIIGPSTRNMDELLSQLQSRCPEAEWLL